MKTEGIFPPFLVFPYFKHMQIQRRLRRRNTCESVEQPGVLDWLDRFRKPARDAYDTPC